MSVGERRTGEECFVASVELVGLLLLRWRALVVCGGCRWLGGGGVVLWEGWLRVSCQVKASCLSSAD